MQCGGQIKSLLGVGEGGLKAQHRTLYCSILVQPLTWFCKTVFCCPVVRLHVVGFNICANLYVHAAASRNTHRQCCSL